MCLLQGSDDDSQSATHEGADRPSQPAGSGGQLHRRGAEQENRVPGYASDTCCKPGRQQEGRFDYTLYWWLDVHTVNALIRCGLTLFKRDAVLSEPAIQVRRKGRGTQIWALEKMENRLVDMRELYQEWKEFDEDNPVS